MGGSMGVGGGGSPVVVFLYWPPPQHGGFHPRPEEIDCGSNRDPMGQNCAEKMVGFGSWQLKRGSGWGGKVLEGQWLGWEGPGR